MISIGKTAAVLMLASALAATGCSKSANIGARSSAAATSTVARTGEQDARALFAHCIPQTSAGLAELLGSKAAREDVMQCGGVPKGRRLDAAACTLTGLEASGKLPNGKQAKEEAVLNAAFPCVQKYQDRPAGTPSPSASGR